jgi:2-C-methyl-D-erythritol 4-phosphate cytidylyltransferase
MNWAVIVAAGIGRRMGGRVRKPYLPLGGMPILGHTLQTFSHIGQFAEILLVTAAEDLDACHAEVVAPLALSTPVRLVAGGRERQESVFNGLDACRGGDDDLVLIHDGVRPLVTAELVGRCLASASSNGASILAITVSDTLKKGLPDGSIDRTLARDAIWQAQTPQGFRLGLIRAAHDKARQEGFAGTDDAQLVERLGHPVFIVPGSRSNIKITHPDDLVLAEAIWREVQ